MNLRKGVGKVFQRVQKFFKQMLAAFGLKRNDSSQAGEATELRKIFGKDHPGYLVEIGAHDGSSLSNSAQLIASGWKAILFEPLPGPFEKLARKYVSNKDVVCLNLAISNTTGQQNFFIGSDGPDGMMSTLSTDDNAWFAHAKSGTTIDVRVDTLTNVLTAQHSPAKFDLLLIDAEGMDYECLLGMDFDLFSPQVIVTEIYEWDKEKHKRKEALLMEKGYRLHKTVGCNTIWVRKDGSAVWHLQIP